MYNSNMMGEHLEILTREELIDLVLQLQGRVAELEARLVSNICLPPPQNTPPPFCPSFFR